MIPRVTSRGRSFKGAALYYLHDKERDTSERVAFTETVNLATDDLRRATAHMIDTAANANELKKAAGVKAGRKLQQPVYTYSLAWHPSQKPTKAEQIEAARDSLKAIGMADRQAMIVAHCDTDHQHVHVIVNRVCPQTGKAASYKNDRLKLSEWAEGYERKHGKVFCEERVANNAERSKGKWRKDDSPPRNQYLEWKKHTTKQLWDQHRADTKAMKADRGLAFDSLWQQRENRMATRKAEVKHQFKPIWRDVFKRQKSELKSFDNSLSARLKFAREHYSGLGSAKAMVRAFTGDQGQRLDYIRMQERERAKLADRQKQHIRDAGREVSKAWKYDRDQLKAAYAQEDQARHERTKAETDRVWKGQSPDESGADFQEAARGAQEAEQATPPPSQPEDMRQGFWRAAQAAEEAQSKGKDQQQPEAEAQRKTTADLAEEHLQERRKRSRGRKRKR